MSDPNVASVHRAVWTSEPIDHSALVEPWRSWAEAWLRLRRGDFEVSAAVAEQLEREASSRGDAALLIEAAVLRSLALGEANRLEEATSVARRAARMARTEAIPTQEVSAALILARLRRLSGFPHLATRILSSLLRYADPRFEAWIRWELLLSGTRDAILAERSTDSRLAQVAHALEQTLGLAEAGLRDEFVQSGERLIGLAEVEPMATEVRAVLAACGVPIAAVPGRSIPSLDEWLTGLSDVTPASLHGILARPGAEVARVDQGALVLAEPSKPGRRIVPLAAPLHTNEYTELRRTRRKDGRRESIVAMLALAGAPVEVSALFERVYGFPYQRGRHAGPFGVGLHRARGYLEEWGTVQQGDGQVVLSLHHPILVPDPRCDTSVHDSLLCVVAEQGATTASALAKALGKSVRWTQLSLAELVADGACVGRREGRAVVYAVEDTTFSEPTYAK